VLDVKTAIVRGKVKRMRRGFGKQPNWKKAIVHVHHEDDIPLFEGA
jgi:large subunit ribosomal protein L23